MKEIVCVTGASGFIAGHIVLQLLEKGYTVRATVRSISDQRKTKFLHDLQTKFPEQLFLFEADLSKEGSFDKAIETSTIVIHTACPALFVSKDPKDIYEPSIRGTQNVFSSIRKNSSVKIVVMTSSTAAIRNVNSPGGRTYSESDWNNLADPQHFPYQYGKTEAEKWAWKYVENEMPNVKLVTILPNMTVGPVQNDVLPSSMSVIKSLIAGDYPGCPKMFWTYVDVRDVALAHILAFESPNARGRYIVASDAFWFVDIAKILKKNYPFLNISCFEIPNFISLLGGLFDKRISIYHLWTTLGKKYELDNSKVKKELGIKFRPVENAIVEAAKSLMDRKLVAPKPPSKTKKLVVFSAIIGVGAIIAYFVNQKKLL